MPAPLLAVLARAGVAVAAAATTPPSPSPRARAACPRRWWDRPLVKLGLASLVPGAIALQRAPAHRLRRRFLGEYYLMGLGAWLASAGRYWRTSLALPRALGGLLPRGRRDASRGSAPPLAPGARRGVRSAAERSAALLYYVSIPALLALRFLAYAASPG